MKIALQIILALLLALTSGACTGSRDGREGGGGDGTGGGDGDGGGGHTGDEDGSADLPVDGGPEPMDETDAGMATSCEADWALGETFYTGDSIGGACEPHNAPQNCRTGDFIMFDDTGECVCIAACSRFVDIGLGDPCTEDGSWTCQHIEANNGNNGQFCVPVEWNLCTR